VAALHVLHHALGLRVVHDGLAGLPGKVIDLFDLPALAFGITPGAFLVVFGAFALGLVLGRNPNPDADRLVQGTIFLHSTTSYLKHNSLTRKKCRQIAFISYARHMLKGYSVSENELARFAKRFRKQAGKTRAQAAREMEVSQTSIFQAEEKPAQGLLKLRARMIEAYSPFKVVGPVFHLERK
jgi:DNA-binding XRE family transcriptional regulator